MIERTHIHLFEELTEMQNRSAFDDEYDNYYAALTHSADGARMADYKEVEA